MRRDAALLPSAFPSADDHHDEREQINELLRRTGVGSKIKEKARVHPPAALEPRQAWDGGGD